MKAALAASVLLCASGLFWGGYFIGRLATPHAAPWAKGLLVPAAMNVLLACIATANIWLLVKQARTHRAIEKEIKEIARLRDLLQRGHEERKLK